MMKTTKSRTIIKCPNCEEKENTQRVLDNKFSIYFCTSCLNGFTHPKPVDIRNYYHSRYWTSSGIIGKLKNFVFYIFQARRTTWIKAALSNGKILDVGSGEGMFVISLPKRYKVECIEQEGSRIKNKSIIKTDLLSWKTNRKFDAICFWESLEHISHPEEYLKKAYSLLDNNGKIFIEFPRYDSLESRLFGKNWFHLDLPRHLTHFTEKGILILLERAGFKNVKVKNVLSLDYAPWGFTASLLNYVKKDTTDYFKKTGNLFLFLLLVPVILSSIIIELIFLFLNESPIALALAEKSE